MELHPHYIDKLFRFDGNVTTRIDLYHEEQSDTL